MRSQCCDDPDITLGDRMESPKCINCGYEWTEGIEKKVKDPVPTIIAYFKAALEQTNLDGKIAGLELATSIIWPWS